MAETGFLDHLRKYISLSDSDTALLQKCAAQRLVKNKEYLLEEGQICQASYFVVDGCLRMYLNTDYGTEQIVQFAINNWWMSDYTSMDRQRPSLHYIQAVEKTTVVILEKNIQEDLFAKIPKLERYFRIIHQRAYSATLARIHFILNLSGEQRYHHFANSFPDFVQRVPQYMLASYLGFTPEFLSKIRAKKT
jgi:CRP-like cAMP-binding protein